MGGIRHLSDSEVGGAGTAMCAVIIRCSFPVLGSPYTVLCMELDSGVFVGILGLGVILSYRKSPHQGYPVHSTRKLEWHSMRMRGT